MTSAITLTPKIILGLDPGLGTTGYGVIEVLGNKIKMLGYGTISTKPGQATEVRLLELKKGIINLLRLWSPYKIIIEKLIVGKNISTAVAVGQARGVLLAECAASGIPIIELAPTQIKLGVTGYGKASKGQVNRMLKTQLNIKKPITPDDASDALAMAVAGINY